MNEVLKLMGIVLIAKEVFGGTAQGYLQNLQIGNPKFRIVNANFLNLSIEIDLPVFNHNAFGVTVKDFGGMLWYGQLPIGSVQLKDPKHLTPKTQAVGTLSVKVQNLVIINDIVQLALSGQWKQPLRLVGTLVTPQFTVPVDKTFKLIA